MNPNDEIYMGLFYGFFIGVAFMLLVIKKINDNDKY